MQQNNQQQLQIFQVDAFSQHCFQGNPASVVPLQEWLSDSCLQQIAAENNQSETAFFVPLNSSTADFEIRWFTPTMEVKLCGHATLASAHVLKHHLDFGPEQVVFSSQSGPLKVNYRHQAIQLDFPATAIAEKIEGSLLDNVKAAIGNDVIHVYDSEYLIVRLADESQVLTVKPDFCALAALPRIGVIVTSQSADYDFVSRFFAPQAGIDEDPVTGSAHCILTPYWHQQTQKTQFNAKQISPRGGEVFCELADDRVLMTGQAVTYLTGTIRI